MIHFILPGDTLENIAEQIKLENPVYLKEFHNLHCIKEDFITENLVPGKKLLIPDFKKIESYNAKNDAPFKSKERNPVLSFNPQSFDKSFRIKIIESSENQWKKTEQKFSYRAYLKWIKHEHGEHLFHFSKDRFSNMHQTKMNHLAIESMKSLDPLELYTNDKGEILRVKVADDKLKNVDQIREKLYDRFPDAYAKLYLEEFEFVISQPDLFSKKMKEDWFLKIYFSAFRNTFENGKSYFNLYLNDSQLEILQTGEIISDKDEVKLIQKLSESSNPEDVFKGDFLVSKTEGMPKKINIHHSYQQQYTQFSTEFVMDPLS